MSNHPITAQIRAARQAQTEVDAACRLWARLRDILAYQGWEEATPRETDEDICKAVREAFKQAVTHECES